MADANRRRLLLFGAAGLGAAAAVIVPSLVFGAQNDWGISLRTYGWLLSLYFLGLAAVLTAGSGSVGVAAGLWAFGFMGIVGGVIANAFYDSAVRRVGHNLWPLEVALVGALSLSGTAIGTVAGGIVAWRRRHAARPA